DYNGGGSGSASAARAAALAEGVLRAMSWTRLKAAMTVVLAASLLMLGTAAVMPRTSAKEQLGPVADGDRRVRPKWEYKVMDKSEIGALAKSEVVGLVDKQRLADGLNALGDEGWELVTIEAGVPAGQRGLAPAPTRYVFKREKK